MSSEFIQIGGNVKLEIRDPMQIIYEAYRNKQKEIAIASRLPISPRLKNITLRKDFYQNLLKFLTTKHPHISLELFSGSLYGAPVIVKSELPDLFQLQVG